MKKTITTLLILCSGFTSLFAQQVPELLYYKFDGTGTSVPNLASAPPAGTTSATLMGGLTQGSTGQCHGAVIGSGNSSTTDYVNTGYATNLTGTSWTISMWTSNITPSATLFYIFGDASAGSFRCFTNGVAGANNWILRGTGITDVLVNGGATVAPHVTTFVYDINTNTIYAYLDGVLVNTVAQGSPTISGAGPFKVIGYASNVGAPSNGLLDEFRMYSRALSASEVALLAGPPAAYSTFSIASCVNYTVPSGNATYTTSGTYNDTIPAIGECGDSIMTINLTINQLPVVSLGPDFTQCASATIDAGNTGSTYLWSDASTNQMLTVTTSGIYSAMVTDVNGCSNSDTIMVTVNPLPVVSLGSDITQCGGSALLDAGNTGSTYLWSDASMNQMLTVTSSGIYSAMVTDTNACSNADTIMVTINPLPTVTLGADTTQCGGSITLDAQNAGSTYLWSDASSNQMLTVSASGTYSAMVTDANGCSNSDTVMVTINMIPVVTLGPDVTQCGSAILDAGNAGSSFLWNDGSTTEMITATSSGTYSVTVTFNGCSNSDTIMATINPIPSVTANATSNTVCVNDAAVTLTGTPNGGFWSGTGVGGTSFDPMTAGTGTFVATYDYTDANTCTNTATVSITVNACTGVEEQSLLNGVSIYPNPNNGTFTLAVNANVGDLKIVISDMQGRVVYSSLENNVDAGFVQQIDLQNESAGIYFMQISGNGQQRVDKISVQK